MRMGSPQRRQHGTHGLDAQPFGEIEIDDEKASALGRDVAATIERQHLARPPDREKPLKRWTAFVVITEQKNDDTASGEASI